MNRHHDDNGKGFRTHWVHLLFFLLVMLPLGCGDDGQSGPTNAVAPSDTGSASLTVHWHDTSPSQPSSTMRSANLDCAANGVETMRCDVYAPDGIFLADGGPWPCTDGGAIIDRIEAGPDRVFVVLAEDADGNIRFQGETSGVAITAGEITVGVTVDAYSFIPTLTAPDTAALIDPAAIILKWEPVDNAEEYLVLIADDMDFQNIVTDETTPDTAFTPADLQPSSTYYWKIQAVDPHTNLGAPSQVNSFTTTDCGYTISSAMQSISAVGGTHEVTITATHDGCQWIAATTSEWIEITPANGSGSGTATVTISTNDGAQRTAQIVIAGNTHTVNQEAAACGFTITPPSHGVNPAGGTHDVSVTATHSGCEWTAATTSEWIEIAPPAGSGDGTVRLTVATNTDSARSAQVTIAGHTHAVSQAASECDFSISRQTQSVNGAGGAHDVTVSATHSGCEWTAATTSDWIEITPATGSGDGTVRLTVAANTGAARSAPVTIAGQSHVVSQDPGACSFSISPQAQRVNGAGGAHEVTVTATHSGCEWTAATTSDWIEITPASGSGDGTVRLTVATNTGAARSAPVTIAGQSHNVNQDPAACNFTISPANQSIGADGGEHEVTVTATHDACQWTASESSDWIEIVPTTGSGSGAVRLTVEANTGAARSAQVTIAGQSLDVEQDPVACSFTISPTTQTVSPSGGNYTITVEAPDWCEWSAETDSDWLEIATTLGPGSGNAGVTVSAYSGLARSARIIIAGHTHTVYQGPSGGLTIGDVSYRTVRVNDDRCSYSLPFGSLFEVEFSYGDSTGNGPTDIDQAGVHLAWDFPGSGDGEFRNYSWGNGTDLTGDGYAGRASIWQCYRFGSNRYVDVTMTIRGQTGETSNPGTIRIIRPNRAN